MNATLWEHFDDIHILLTDIDRNQQVDDGTIERFAFIKQTATNRKVEEGIRRHSPSSSEILFPQNVTIALNPSSCSFQPSTAVQKSINTGKKHLHSARNSPARNQGVPITSWKTKT